MKGYAIVVICMGVCALASSYVFNPEERAFLRQQDVVEYLEYERETFNLAETGCTCADTCTCKAPIGEGETADITVSKSPDTIDDWPCITLSVKVGGKPVFDVTLPANKFYHRSFVYGSMQYFYKFEDAKKTDDKLTGKLTEIYTNSVNIGEISLPLH